MVFVGGIFKPPFFRGRGGRRKRRGEETWFLQDLGSASLDPPPGSRGSAGSPPSGPGDLSGVPGFRGSNGGGPPKKNGIPTWVALGSGDMDQNPRLAPPA